MLLATIAGKKAGCAGYVLPSNCNATCLRSHPVRPSTSTSRSRQPFVRAALTVNGPRTGAITDVGSVRARADFVPGTRGRTSASGRLIDWVDAFLKQRKYDVRHDVPYAGGFTTQHYGRPADGVHVIQLEMARRLYMDEPTCTPIPRAFEALQNTCRDLVAEIATVKP